MTERKGSHQHKLIFSLYLFGKTYKFFSDNKNKRKGDQHTSSSTVLKMWALASSISIIEKLLEI
jgi:hypothetical protein